ncbi:phosphoribosyltransferase-like protein [Labrys miyagiensis]|uniref:phosphoribosyltransferase-like protein n=1 Tax=Labrys miyagiensis TaxID=346912 RepID=UPI0024E0DE0E|nr:hypothetical protein [Labrys miyagiensis]
MSREEVFDRLLRKVKQLTESAWYGKVLEPDVRQWLAQFTEASLIEDDEQLQALFLLTNFIYFGQQEIRELLKSLYRDLFRTPAIHQIRKSNGGTKDLAFLAAGYQDHLRNTRFLGVGNPSESGVHLLYYFRQENLLSSAQFINTHEIFARDATSGGVTLKIRNAAIQNYVFIDDICGSGTQAELYSRDIVNPLRALKHDVRIDYLVLFATRTGLEFIKNLNRYDTVAAIYVLDDSFKSLDPNSRIFGTSVAEFDRLKVRATCEKYGKMLCPLHPLGYKDGQLLMGFNHNTPDNTLPIFWADDPWRPMFKRYNKV